MLGRRLRGYFVAGLLVLIPLSLTIYVVYQLFGFIDGILNKSISQAFYAALGIDGRPPYIPGLGFLTLLVLIFFSGILARNFIGKRLIFWSENILGRIPVIRHIYGTFQQISQAFLADQSQVFKRAALIEYPKKDIYSIGFITQDTRGPVQDCLDKDVVSVFLPTTPNPTSGYLLFVPKADVTLLDITVEEALKLVISGGSIVPAKTSIKKLEDTFGIEEH